MRRWLVVACGGVVLVLSAHRLPAPIQEAPSPEPESSPESNRKSLKGNRRSEVGSMSRFEGTWHASVSRTSKFGNTIKVNQTLIIRNGSAEYIGEETGTLASGRKWNDIPEPYNSASPLYSKRINHSTSIKSEGSNLRIFWQGAKLVSWSPNSVPSTAFKNPQGTPSSVLLILSGDHLIDTNGKQSQTYSRVQ